MYIYTRIRELREDNDLSQKQVASYLGMAQTQYSRYERGAQEIPLHHMISLAKYYRVSMDYICSKVQRRGAM